MSESTEQSGKEASSSSNPCPICLSSISQPDESYLDRCFHKFCYKCIVQWTKMVASKHSEPLSSVKCPLCKTENFSIIYGYDGTSFMRHFINQIFNDNDLFTEAHKYRLQCYYVQPGVSRDTFDVTRFWKSQKYVQSNRWLHDWLTREIQALLQEEDVHIIMQHMLGIINSSLRDEQGVRKPPEVKQAEFRELVSNAARPFLAGRAERFTDEVELFLASGLNLEAYDDVYMKCLGWNRNKNEPDGSAGPTDESNSESAAVAPSLFIFEGSDADE